jgi:hypothetical protein
MSFKFKLSKRLAMAWFRRRPPLRLLAAVLLPHASPEMRLALIVLPRFASVQLRWTVIGNRRRYQQPTTARRRLDDYYPCWHFFIACVVVRFAIHAIPNVAA